MEGKASKKLFKDVIDEGLCILCGGCTSSCPSAWYNQNYFGPAALLKAYRFIFDSRDRAREERIKIINSADGLWRCHTIFNCVEACPKEINVTDLIAKLKRKTLKMRW